MSTWAAVVRIAHLAFVAFMVLAPFGRNRVALVAHLVVMPFVWAHWLLNDDTCALTVLECTLRGVEPSQSFVHSLVGPVYAAGFDATWVASILLWTVTLTKVGWRDVREVALGAWLDPGH